MWPVATTSVFSEWFSELNDSEKVEVIAKVNLLKLLGPKLARPHADTLKGSKHANMKELRADTGRARLRIAFAFDPNRQALLLVAGNKAGKPQQRFYKQLISRADELFDLHLTSLRRTTKE